MEEKSATRIHMCKRATRAPLGDGDKTAAGRVRSAQSGVVAAAARASQQARAARAPAAGSARAQVRAKRELRVRLQVNPRLELELDRNVGFRARGVNGKQAQRDYCSDARSLNYLMRWIQPINE